MNNEEPEWKGCNRNHFVCKKRMKLALQQGGFKLTVPRLAVINILAASEKYMSTDDIYFIIQKEFPEIGIASVYRTLNLLVEMKIVIRHEFGEGKARYELTDSYSEKHSHSVICEKCRKIIRYDDFTPEEEQYFKDIEKNIESKYHYKINRHSVVYYGLCEECQKSDTSK